MSTAAWADPWDPSAEPPDGFAAGLSMGMLEAKRRDVLRTIQLRYRANVPSDMAAQVRSIDELDRLDRWLDAAITAPNYEVFRATVAWADGQFSSPR